MPMRYTIDSTQRVIRITGSGPLTDAEMEACVAALRGDPALEYDMPTLSDMRNIEVAFTPNGIQRVINIMHDAPADRAMARVAIVVSTDVAFGMGRMFSAQLDEAMDPSFQIFRDMAEAEAWLALKPDTKANDTPPRDPPGSR